MTHRCLAVGYGSRSQPVTVAGLILMPSMASGAADKVWVYGTAWTGLTPPTAGWHWLYVAASPRDKTKWLALGNSTDSNPTKFDVVSGIIKAKGTSLSPLWYSGDSGASWSQVSLAHPYETSHTAGSTSVASFVNVEWSDQTEGAWYLVGSSDTVGLHSTTTYFYRGTNGTAALQGTFTTGFAFGRLIAGSGGDIVHPSQFPSTESKLRYVPQGATAFTTVGVDQAWASIIDADRRGGASREVAMIATDDIWATPDYRTTTLALRLNAPSFSCLTATHDAWYASHQSGGIGLVRITNLFGTPEQTTIAGTSGADIHRVRADRQTRLTVGALKQPPSTSNPATIYLYKDGTLTTITGPAALPWSDISTSCLEVLGG